MMATSSSSGAPSDPLTVVIPAYNLASYLPATVESVLRQSYAGPLHIIILDDGSSDQTLDVAKAMAAAHDNIAVHSQPNQGRAITRDRLLRMAETPWVAWIDADDMASPGWLADQALYLSQHDEVAAVGGQGYAMTPRGFAIGPIVHPTLPQEIDRRHIEGHANAFFQSCVLTRRDKMIQAGGYRKQYPAAEDYDLWLRLAEVAPLANLEQTHLLYRVHGASANWTLNIDQRQQGHQIMNEARRRRGLDEIDTPNSEIPPSKKDDWNRRVYWINIALRSGNPFSALTMIPLALRRHPISILFWGAMLVAICDCVLFMGNRTRRFRAGQEPVLRPLPPVSVYRLVRTLVRWRRQLRSPST